MFKILNNPFLASLCYFIQISRDGDFTKSSCFNGLQRRVVVSTSFCSTTSEGEVKAFSYIASIHFANMIRFLVWSGECEEEVIISCLTVTGEGEGEGEGEVWLQDS